MPENEERKEHMLRK